MRSRLVLVAGAARIASMTRGFYTGRLSYWSLVLPILVLIVMFFYIPVALAFFWSFFLERPFGGGSEFVGFQNYGRVLSDPEFWNAMWRTLIFMVVAPGLAIGLSLILALAADRSILSVRPRETSSSGPRRLPERRSAWSSSSSSTLFSASSRR